MRSGLILAAGLIVCSAHLLALGTTARAQTEVYCTVTSVKSEALTNATRVTIQADGILEVEIDGSSFWEHTGTGWQPRRTRTLSFGLVNARSKLGSFVDVAIYPISHLHFSVPRESREGVGLDVTAVLYRGAILESIEVQWDWWNIWGARQMPPSFILHQSRDGRSLDLIIRSDRYREQGLERQEVEAERSSLSVSADEDGLLTVRALNAQLGDVLRAISDTNGVQIAVRGGADYRASMAIEKAAPTAVMRAVARAYGLSVRVVGGIYYVTEGLPTEVDAYWAAPTVSFGLSHVSADVALDLLPDFLLRYVHADAQQNALVATGPPQLLDKLGADLRLIDRPQPQIRLSALVVEELSADALDLASEIIFGSGQHEFEVSGETGRLSYRRADDALDDLHVKLRALEAKGCIRTEVCPSVTVRSGEPAELFLGRRHYFQALSSGYDQEVYLDATDVGSSIAAEPWTGDGEVITLPLRVQANTVLSLDAEGRPLVATRQAKGTVRIRSGETIVLGGLTIDTSDHQRRRAGPKELPLVGDIGRARRHDTAHTSALVLLSATADRRPETPTRPREPALQPEQG